MPLHSKRNSSLRATALAPRPSVTVQAGSWLFVLSILLACLSAAVDEAAVTAVAVEGLVAVEASEVAVAAGEASAVHQYPRDHRTE